jgi:S-adenosylmethionine hydrolase
MKPISSAPLIALLTDFGNEDPFVGVMKGVIAKFAPQARMVDITHRIPPGDIQRAAIMLWQSIPYFPAGTIFLTVVDPGVGTLRRGIIAQKNDQIFIGPDNGLFSFVLKDDYQAWELANSEFQLPQLGNTFHGRDIFAPAAAHHAQGIAGNQFGGLVADLVQLKMPRLEITADQIKGEILYSDHFGNLLTSLGKFVSLDKKLFQLEPWLDIGAIYSRNLQIARDQASLSLPNGSNLLWVDTFAEIPTGNCGILIGSSGLIEIAANRMKVADLLDIDPGDPVILLY